MTVWVVRGGSRGEHEETFMSEGIAAIGFGMGKSVAHFASRESLREYAESRSAADSLWRFVHDIRGGDMVVLPRKSPRVVAVGQVSGDYEFRPSLEAPHIRAVNWVAQEIPLTDFEPDFLNSFGGQGTVYRIQATDAESRIKKIVAKHSSTIPEDDDADLHDSAELSSSISEEDAVKADLEEQINNRIVERIRQRFYGTRLEYLVASILRASGYHAVETRQGPDGGIDVVAGQGDMGFGRPRLCVQVKSGRSPVGLVDYNRLQGNIGSYGADHGLLVSLGDFTRAVRNENERSFFQIRLWGPDDLVNRLEETYDVLPDDIRNEIPLRNRKILMEWED